MTLCDIHRNYTAQRSPRGSCNTCWKAYKETPAYIARQAKLDKRVKRAEISGISPTSVIVDELPELNGVAVEHTYEPVEG